MTKAVPTNGAVVVFFLVWTVPCSFRTISACILVINGLLHVRPICPTIDIVMFCIGYITSILRVGMSVLFPLVVGLLPCS